ncbi:MAG: glycosyltransferase [Lachnospiraceae bacterium]|nr:glycosyltransferase [Lachnospiraceae bacterium]
MSIVQNVRKTINYGRKNGYKEALCAAWERVTARYYADYTYIAPERTEIIAQREDDSVKGIKLSLAVPAFETKPEYMRALIQGCLDQSYENWELIIADGSETDLVAQTVVEYQDERIRYIRLEDNEGIADNTNQALSYAEGEYCGLLDHDDLLTPDALYHMAKVIAECKQKNIAPVMLYSDEDKCDSEGKNFFDPHFKLDFNLDLIMTNNYICHFMMIKTEELKRLQIRKQYDGAQDFDLVLRIVSSLLLKEREGQGKKVEEQIVHVPRVLYHWRCHEASTAENPLSKMYAYEAGRKALADFTKRMGWKADIRHNKHLGFYRIAYRNCVLQHRDDLAAVGGFVVSQGKVRSGLYKGQPLIYAGYMNRMDLYQNVTVLDIRNLAVNKKYHALYEKITGYHYVNTFYEENEMSENTGVKELPQWMQELDAEQLEKLNRRLSRQLLADGGRLLLDPENIRKI